MYSRPSKDTNKKFKFTIKTSSICKFSFYLEKPLIYKFSQFCIYVIISKF